MDISFVGDIHGEYKFLTRLQPNTIQLGDFDLRGYSIWGKILTDDQEKKLSVDGVDIKAGKRYFVDGNHDCFPELNPNAENPYEIQDNLVYIPRGYISGKTMFIGGADCVPHDRALRTPGVSWYPEETLSVRQFNKIMDTDKEVEVIISHDCPQFVVNQIVMSRANYYGYSHGNLIYSLPTNRSFDCIFDKLRPKMWIFAHHHYSFDRELRGCRFICLNIGEVRTIDVPVLDDFFKEKD